MHPVCKCLTSIVFLFLAFTRTPCQEQTWWTVAPVGETFKLLMPTEAVQVSRQIPLSDKDSVRERVYYSFAEGRRYMAISFMKTAPDRVLALSSFDNFVAGVKRSLASREGESATSLTFDRDVPSSATVIGKQYHSMLAGFPATTFLLETDKSFYVLMVIGANANDPDVQRFLSSFALTETNTDSLVSGVIIDVPSNSSDAERVRTASPPEPWSRAAGPINGGVLNGKATNLVVPEYPEQARAAGESAQVEVEIIIDEQGSVVWAEASVGPASLRDAAVAAAKKSRFAPTKLMSQPVKVKGRIVYNFAGR